MKHLGQDYIQIIMMNVIINIKFKRKKNVGFSKKDIQIQEKNNETIHYTMPGLC
jgi:hypothetical protein